MAQGIYDISPAGLRREAADVAIAKGALQHGVSLRLELEDSLACWYEMLLNPPEWDARRKVVDQLRLMQAKGSSVPMSLHHGDSYHSFVCFWASRTKVRFCLNRKPRFTLFNNDFVFYVELGQGRIRKKLSTTFVDSQTGEAIKPHIELEEGHITITLSDDEEPEKVSVHNFLRKCGLELDIPTYIHALSSTQTPVDTWLSGADRRLTQMLYHVPNEEHDFFLFCNLFKVTFLHDKEQAYNPAFLVAGRPSEGVYFSVHERDLLIEKAFAAYFQLSLQQQASDIKQGEASGANGPNHSIQVLMELENPHELYRFGSWKQAAADKHIFACDIKGQHISVADLK